MAALSYDIKIYIREKENKERNVSMRKKRGVFFKKMLLLYTISTTAVFLLFGIWVAAYEQSKYNEQIREINRKALSQSASACSTTLQDLYNYIYIETLDSPELVGLLLAEEYSQEMAWDFYRLGNSLCNFNSLIDSCYVINQESDFACSTLDVCRSLEEFKDRDILERLTGDKKDGLCRFIPRSTSYTIYGKPYEKQYISIVFQQYGQGYLVVNLKYDLFADMVNYRNYNENSRTLLLNSQGTVMIDSNSEWFGVSLADTDYYKTLLTEEERDGVFRQQVDGRRKEICYRTGELFDIKYVTITECRVLDQDSLAHVIVLAALAVVINLGCIFAGTTLLYRPIGKLSAILSGDDEEQIDEFRLIEDTFFHLKKENRTYQESTKERVLGNILEDNWVQDEAAEAELSLLQESMDKTSFVCVNLYPEIEGSQKGDLPLMLFAIENVIRELTEKHMQMRSVKYDTYLSCIFNADFGSGGGRIEILEMPLTRLQEKMQEYFGMDVVCAVGNVVNNVFDLTESAANARTAAFFQLIREKNAILYWEEMPQRAEPGGAYPAEQVKNLLDALRNCDKGKIRMQVAGFFAEIAVYTHAQALKCIFMLENDLFRYEMRYDIDTGNSEWEMTEFARQSSGICRIQEKCLEHCLKIADAYREIRDNNPNMLGIVDRVRELVEENITNPELSVNAIAQQVYLSNSYLRNIFKEVTGGTLSNYIIEKKLEKICTMLEQTEMSAQQIADAMNFSSKSYLFTFFKNYMGMTPAQYRREKKPE